MEHAPILLTNEDPAFYPLLGPFLANRVVAKAYGDRIWDDPGMTWAIARNSQGMVIGFAALTPQRYGAKLCNDYVLPEYRDDLMTIQGILVDALLSVYPTAPITVVASEAEKTFYEARGFVFIRRIGQYLEMKREAKNL